MNPIYFMEKDDRRINSDFPFNLFKQYLNEDIPSHGHDFLEIHFVMEGHGVEIINGHQYEMKPGTFAIILPHQIHEMHIVSDEAIHLYNFGISLKVFFNNEESSLALHQLLFNNETNVSPLYNLNENISARVHQILREMHFEYRNEQYWSHLLFKAKLVELLVLYDRYRKSFDPQKASSQLSQQKNDIWAIIQYVYRNYREPLSLQSLSRRFFISVPYISASFKKYLGVNFHHFLRKIRLDHACSLLTSSKISITEIVFEVGFESYSTFVRVFHSQKGMSPSEYRKLHGSAVGTEYGFHLKNTVIMS